MMLKLLNERIFTWDLFPIRQIIQNHSALKHRLISHDCSLAELPEEGLPLLHVVFGGGGLTRAQGSRWLHSRLVPPAGLAGPLPFMWSLIIQSPPWVPLLGGLIPRGQKELQGLLKPRTRNKEIPLLSHCICQTKLQGQSSFKGWEIDSTSCQG